MGNHTAGQAMGRAAEMATKMRTTQTAIELLDEICEPWRGCDAEFEAEDPKRPGYTNPDFSDYRDPHAGAALGMLMLEAFAPNGVADLPRYAAALGYDQHTADTDAAEEASDAAADLWYSEVCQPFRARYEFC